MYIKMKSNLTNLTITFFVIVFITMSLLCSCSNVQPYSIDNVFLKQYPYEGYANMSTNYSNIDNSNDSATNKFLINKFSNQDCSKVKGFNGLFCKPYVADNKVDLFSQVNGEAKCDGNSSGLYNSKGGLCLDNNLKNLLRTRGGNQTGGNDQIGGK